MIYFYKSDYVFRAFDVLLGYAKECKNLKKTEKRKKPAKISFTNYAF